MNETNKINIFDFNHIDINLDPEKLQQIKDFYEYYKKTWIYTHNYTRHKKEIT